VKSRYLIISICSIFLTACGAEDSSKSSPSLASFDLTPYRNSNENVSNSSLEGTWIASWSIKQERSDVINASVVPKVESNRLETFVIRPSGEGFERSYCGGGFDPITINGNDFITAHSEAKVANFSYMQSSLVETGKVQLSPVASYKETVTLNIEYIKISDKFKSFGTLKQNWSDTDVIIERDIYCSNIDNLEEGYRSVFIASDNEMLFKISNFIDPSSFDAFIKDPDHDGQIANRLTLGKQSFYFSVDDPASYIFNYSAENFNGLAVTGQVTLNIPITE
jgi:hypothetical protein